MVVMDIIGNTLTETQKAWAENYAKTENGMLSVRVVWPHTKDNAGYQNTRAWKLKNNKRVMEYVNSLKS
jgi:hypothetical protein